MTEISTAPEVSKPSRFSFLRRTKPAIPPIPSPVEETPEPEMTKEELFARFREAGQIEDVRTLETIASKFELMARIHGYRGTIHIAGGSVDKTLPRDDIDAFVTIENMPEGQGNSKYYKNKDRLQRHFIPFITQILPAGYRLFGTTDPHISEQSNNLDDIEGDAKAIFTKEGTTPIEFTDNTNPGEIKPHLNRKLVLLAQTPTNG